MSNPNIYQPIQPMASPTETTIWDDPQFPGVRVTKTTHSWGRSILKFWIGPKVISTSYLGSERMRPLTFIKQRLKARIKRNEAVLKDLRELEKENQAYKDMYQLMFKKPWDYKDPKKSNP